MARRESAITYLNFIANRVMDWRPYSKSADKLCGKSHFPEFPAELSARLELNSMDADFSRTLHIGLAIINKQGLGRMHVETLKTVLVNSRIGLDHADFTGKNMTIEIRQPMKVLAGMNGHILRHVRQDRGFDSSRTQIFHPLHHFGIDRGPHLHVPHS